MYDQQGLQTGKITYDANGQLAKSIEVSYNPDKTVKAAIVKHYNPDGTLSSQSESGNTVGSGSSSELAAKTAVSAAAFAAEKVNLVLNADKPPQEKIEIHSDADSALRKSLAPGVLRASSGRCS